MKIGSKTRMTRELTRQERNRRNNMKRITISALVAFILFIALTIIQSSILNQEAKVSVYQVQQDISAGTKITEDNINEYFNTKDVQVSLIPDGYITDPNLILGKFVTRDYKARDVITVDALKDTAGVHNSSLQSPVELSFSIGDLSSSVSGTIREGDYVNIYGMRNGFNKDDEVVSKVSDNYTFKHIYIDKAYDSSGNVISSENKDADALMFTIIIEEEDVDLFNEMVANCSLKLVKLMYDTDQDYKAFIGKDTAANTNTNASSNSNKSDANVSDSSSNSSSSNNNTNVSDSTSSSDSNDTVISDVMSSLEKAKSNLVNKKQEDNSKAEEQQEEKESSSEEKQSLKDGIEEGLAQ